MITFVLVHGAWHGAWCWERLTPVLQERGHRVIAVDLPATDTAAGCAKYAEFVLDHVNGVPDREMVVVGHSLGGLTIPLIAAARPVRRLVFLCALIPQPGVSLSEQLREQPDMFAPGFQGGPARDELGRALWPDREEAIRAFYADCPRELAEPAAARLRPQASLPSAERSPLRRWPAVPSTYILARDDAAINPHWSRRAARERLAIEALELPGGHSPFISRPLELAEVLLTGCT
jgi:pimeloyl-ACP methyl ester carboxylesterase